MHFVRRGLTFAGLLVLTSLAAFLLVRALPGGPFDRDRAPASPEIERNLRAKFHLDEPLWRQYLRYLGGLARGDLGPSLKFRGHSVADIVRQAAPVSMALGAAAFVVALAAGIPLGVLAAAGRGRWAGRAAGWAALGLICVPSLVAGPVLVLTLAVRWRIFPAGLWGAPAHAVLPVATLALFFTGRVARLMQEGMTGTLRTDYVAAARARGAGEWRVLFRHAARAAVLPVISQAGPMLADLLTGSFVVENIFQLPGLGVFMVNSSLDRDYPLVAGLVLLYAALLLALNFAADSVLGALDPRWRHV